MKENTQEKSLVQVNENSIFYRIKSFLETYFIENKLLMKLMLLKTISKNQQKKKMLKVLLWKRLEKLKMRKLSY